MQDSHLTRIPLFPLHQGLFPGGVVQLSIFEVRYLDLMRQCEASKAPFGIAFLSEGSEVETAGARPKLCSYGTLASIQSLKKVQPYLFKVMCKAGTKFLMKEYERGQYGVWYGKVMYLEEDPFAAIPPHLQYLANKLGRIIADVQKDGQATRLPFDTPYNLEDGGWVANRLADLLPISPDEKNELLAELNPIDRLEMIASKITRSDLN
jgi:uncharacterized protein